MPVLERLRHRLGSLATRWSLAAHVGFNGLAQAAPIIVAVLLTPLLLDRLGLARFGIWSIALITLNTLAALDGGIAASLERFFAGHAARDERAQSAQLLLGSFVFFVVLGLISTLLVFPLAPTIVDVLHIPAPLRAEGVAILRVLPALSALALMADATAALLQGNGQFRQLAVTMVTASTIFAVSVVVLVWSGARLEELAAATALRFVIVIVIGLVYGSPHLAISRPFLPGLATARELWRYASRMQLSALTGFVNGELDALVIALLLPVKYVGLYNIGMQAAAAARSLPLYAFAPLLRLLSTTFRIEGRAAAAAQFARLERRWLTVILGYGIIAVTAIAFMVPIWLGRQYVLSGVMAAILLAGFMVHVGLTGMRTCYVRAVGQPGLETRYSFVWTIGNAVLTVPLAISVGAVGVVAATSISATIASLYFVALCWRRERLHVFAPATRWWYLAIAAGVITATGEVVILQTGIHGYVGLLLSCLPAIASLALLGTAWLRAQAPAAHGAI